MARKKIDAIVEAVRYDSQGRIEFVRMYERIAATFADRKLVQRAELVERLKKGEKFVAGRQIEFQGATFETGVELRLVKSGAGEWVQSGSAAGETDLLQGIPVV